MFRKTSPSNIRSFSSVRFCSRPRLTRIQSAIGQTTYITQHSSVLPSTSPVRLLKKLLNYKAAVGPVRSYGVRVRAALPNRPTSEHFFHFICLHQIVSTPPRFTLNIMNFHDYTQILIQLTESTYRHVRSVNSPPKSANKSLLLSHNPR